MKKVSIIIPVYNVEKYIRYCLESIINQTYKNIEIIIIDDESPDNSINICEELKKKDKRINIYHKKNGGPSSARNYGLKYATGDYIIFIDSDDFAEHNMIEILVNNLEKTDSDLSVCSYKKVYNHEKYKYDNKNSIIELSRQNAYEYMLSNNYFAGYVWNKMYLKEIIDIMEENPFKEWVIEDFEFNCRYLKYCKKICFTNDQLYYYFVNNNGVTGTFSINERVLAGINAYKIIQDEYDRNKISNSDLVSLNKFKYELNLNYRIHKLNKLNKKNLNINVIEKESYNRVMKSKIIPTHQKIYIWISNMIPITSSKIKFTIKKWRNNNL